MADRLGQVLPAVTALGGVALTFVGTAWLELRRDRSERQDAKVERGLQAFSDLVQTLTSIVRMLRATAERLGAHEPLSDGLADAADELVGRARREAALARLVGPAASLELIGDLERRLVPVRRLVGAAEAAARDGDTSSVEEQLIDAGRGLLKLRDDLVAEIRTSQGLS